MKKYTFRLQTVLKVRKIEMEQQARLVVLAEQAVLKKRAEIIELRQQQESEVQRVKKLAQQGLITEQMTELSHQYREQLKRVEGKKLMELQDLVKKLESERIELIEKEKRKKALDKLEERDREKYEDEQKKVERKEMDELASQRWHRT